MDGDRQVVRTTEGHPFFVTAEPGLHLASSAAAGRWVAASDLSAGDRLSLAGHRFAELVSARTEAAPGFKAYNLTVEGFASYFVAETLDDDGVWVHNNCRERGLERLKNAGLANVNLRGASYNRGRKQLEAAGFESAGVTSTGRRSFVHPKTGTRIDFDGTSNSLAAGQKPHWHITTRGGEKLTSSGRVATGSPTAPMSAGHIRGR